MARWALTGCKGPRPSFVEELPSMSF
jgi:hypothetical protein